MANPFYSQCRRTRIRLGALALLGLAAACAGSQTSPSSEGGIAIGDSLTPAPGDSAVTPVTTPIDSTSVPTDSQMVATGEITPQATVTLGTGLPFGIMNMRATNMTPAYNASQLGALARYLMDELKTTRAKGGHMIVKMAGQKDSYNQNADGTFSFSKWKAQVDNYRNLDLSSYIADGTLMGHFLIDEPQHASKWGGKPIPQATVEAMAQYSKQIWPGLTTFARVAPSWLDQVSISYKYLDGAWLQYEPFLRGHPAMPEVTSWATSEVAAAKRKALGLMFGMNVLDGGNGSSGFRGRRTGDWAMSATEIRTYGTALLNQSYACGFLVWTYLGQGATYFARTDIKSAMTDLANKAKTHIHTACSQ